MRPPILPAAARFLVPLILLFSVFLLLRGHHQPGGAFVGGLVAAAGFALHAMAFHARDTARALRVGPESLIAVGLLVLGATAAAPALIGRPLLSTAWILIPLPGDAELEVGTPLLFEAGIYLVVLGATMTVLLLLAEE